MKAMTYYGKDDIRFEERPKPTILEPTDAIIKLTKSTICGTDLGIKHGKNPEIEQVAREKTGEWNGRILGHEGIGIIEEVGSAVKNFIFANRMKRPTFTFYGRLLFEKFVSTNQQSVICTPEYECPVSTVP